MRIKDMGPAFPSHGTMGEVTHEGMTLRDYFAAKAMQAAIANKRALGLKDDADMARRCYATADYMLQERGKK